MSSLTIRFGLIRCKSCFALSAPSSPVLGDSLLRAEEEAMVQWTARRVGLTRSPDNEDNLNRWGDSGASGGDSKYCLGSLSFCVLWVLFWARCWNWYRRTWKVICAPAMPTSMGLVNSGGDYANWSQKKGENLKRVGIGRCVGACRASVVLEVGDSNAVEVGKGQLVAAWRARNAG